MITLNTVNYSVILVWITLVFIQSLVSMKMQEHLSLLSYNIQSGWNLECLQDLSACWTSYSFHVLWISVMGEPDTTDLKNKKTKCLLVFRYLWINVCQAWNADGHHYSLLTVFPLGLQPMIKAELLCFYASQKGNFYKNSYNNVENIDNLITCSSCNCSNLTSCRLLWWFNVSACTTNAALIAWLKDCWWHLHTLLMLP